MARVEYEKSKMFSDNDDDFYFTMTDKGLEDVFGSVYFTLDEIPTFMEWLGKEYAKVVHKK